MWIPSIPYGIYLAEGPAILAYASMFIPYGNSMESITIPSIDSMDSILFQIDSM